MTLLDTSVLIDIIKGKINNIGYSLSIISVMEVTRVLDKVKSFRSVEKDLHNISLRRKSGDRVF